MDHVNYPLEACAGAPMRRPQNRAARPSQMGAATVEFGLLLPLLVLILSGILEFGLALYDKAVITNASREGARAGIVLKIPAVTPDQICDRVQAYAGKSLVSLGNSPSTQVVINACTTDNLKIDFPAQTDPDHLAVRVSYTFRGLGLGNLLSAMGSPLVLTSTPVMVIECWKKKPYPHRFFRCFANQHR